MPRERADFFRESGNLSKDRVFVIAYEGNDTERIYFEAIKEDTRFNDEIICLHLLSRKKEDTNSAPNHVFAKLKKEAKDEYNFQNNDELWMVIDRDRWKNIPEIIQKCKDAGNMYVAGSNPCFELWLLLHIKDLAEYSEVELDSLLKNEKVSSKKTYIERELSAILPDGYNKTNPKPERFTVNLNSAINRAEQLDSSKEEFPTKLGSHVYKIIKSIIKEL